MAVPSNDFLAEENRRLRTELEQSRIENKLLREKLDAMARRLFGKRSEQLNANQLLLLLQEVEAPGPAVGKELGPEELKAEPPRPKQSPQKPRGERKPRLPEHLEVVEEVIVPEEVRIAPQEWSRIGEEVSERLDYIPARFRRLRTVRPKFVKRDEVDAAPLIAALPPSLLERSIVTPNLLAQVVVSKFCDHLPLYRQEAIFWSRHQVWLPRQTLAEWMGLAAYWLRPIYQEIQRKVFERGYVQVDETPIRYLSPGHGKTKLGYLWTCADPKGDVVFHWETSRAAACLENVIPADFQGTVQCDGYEAYRTFARERGGIELVGCLAHARRKFYEARESFPRIAFFILRHIQLLYCIEQKLRDTRAGPKLREATRASESRPIMQRLHRALMLLKKRRQFLPQSAFGRALHYSLTQWPGLCGFLTDGRLEIDNNLVENAIRPSALGKKNWLFFGEAEAGDRGAILYTVIESCRKRGIDPSAYLRDVFARLPTMTNWQIKEVTPEAWAKRKRGEVDLAAAA